MIVGLGILISILLMFLTETRYPSSFIHAQLQDTLSPPLNHYSNTQTVNPMTAVGLMYRLLWLQS